MSEAKTHEEHPENQVSRQDFLKISGILAGSIILTQVASVGIQKARASETPKGAHRWGMAIDINKCIGCNYCTYACQAVNNLSDDMIYNVVTKETTMSGDEYYLSRPCMHCDDPPCAHVCPVKATYVREDGIVTMNYNLCIGCRYCEVACPYDARVFNWYEHTETSPRVPAFGSPEVNPRPRGVVEKCTFCQHRIDKGLERGLVPGVDQAATPACVVACPTGARVFGDLNDPESPISKCLAECMVPLRLREELSTSPKVYYLPPQGSTNSGTIEG
ncbi:MAG: 4Fe-4S dicluster domain-containing protein [Anaerolineales bacterium]|nr:4Fe-4S dicluster domain-containing protein [Anaerolineales bacterium]